MLVPITGATFGIYIWSAYSLAIVNEMGPEGLAWALLIETGCRVLFSSIYAHCFISELRLFWPSSEIFQELKEFMRLAIPSLMIFLLAWSCYELYIVLAGTFDPIN